MWRRMSWVWACVLAAGCWSSEPLVLDAFTPDQWERLRSELALGTPSETELCTFGGMTLAPDDCDRATNLGQALFFEPDLSSDGSVSCASCHDPDRGWADSRAPNNVSLGAPEPADLDTPLWTKRNAIAVTNAIHKERSGAPHPFGWIGGWKRGGQVVPLAQASDVVDLALAKAMRPAPGTLRGVIVDRPTYQQAYDLTFGAIAGHTEPEITRNVKVAIEAYLRRISTHDSPFDRFLAGDEAALTDRQQRGFVVFATRGMCIDCHSGPMFSDFEPHVTGVPQTGPNVVPVGAGGEQGLFELSGDPAELGKFMTPALRDLSRTGPYMHDGAFATLHDVIRFYNDGGGSHAYLGTKDPRLVPLDLDDQDERDLEDFLGALDGTLVNDMVRYDTHLAACPMHPEQKKCDGTCTDLETDPDNCGGCLHRCGGSTCTMGRCTGGAPWCPAGMSSCTSMDMCTDLQVDPANCGYCTHSCATGQACVMGECV